MKKFISAVLLFLLGGILVSCNSTCSGIFIGSVYQNADKYENGSKEFESSIKTLDIDWVSGEISLIQDLTATKTEVIEDTIGLEPDQQVHTYLEGDTLHVRFCKSGYSGIFNVNSVNKKKLVIKFCSLEKIDLSLTSGEANFEDLEVKEFNLSYTSGKATLKNLKADDVKAAFTSGKLYINNLKANKLNVSTTSGEVEIANLEAKDIKTSFTSGKAIYNLVSTTNVDINFTSGKVILTIPTDKAVKLVLDKTSGSIRSDKTCTKVDNEYTFGPMGQEVEMFINVDMTSGTLEIK